MLQEERTSVPAAHPVTRNTPHGPKKRRWFPLALILFVVVLVMGGLATFLVNQSNEKVTKVAKDEQTDAAHHAYIAELSGNGTLAFSDPLNQESGSQWQSEVTTSGTCQFAAGAYHVKQQSAAFMRCNTPEIYSNFAFEVQLTIVEGCGGIVFRDQRDGYFYYFSICPYGQGRYDIARYAGYGKFKQLPYGESAAIHVGANQQNKIAVKASGKSMTFYINEQSIAQAWDDSTAAYTEGTIGLAAYPNIGTVAHIAYTKATLWTM